MEALLEILSQNDGDVNITRKSSKIWKRLAGVDQEDVRTDLLPTAAKVGDFNTIRLLVPHADNFSRNESLSITLNASHHSRTLDIVELLLAFNADASVQHTKFISAVSNSDRDLVGLLLTAPKSVSVRSMTEALSVAVEARALEMVYTLAETNADADDGGGKALKQAIRTTRYELVTAVTSCK